MQDKLFTLFGGGGFLGTYVAQRLLNAGARIRIAGRNIGNARHIKPLGNLGQTQFAVADIRKPETVARAVRGADGVINFVGILDGDFAAFHVEGARNVAKAAAEAGCDALVQVSAIGADPQSKSRYGRSKADGEAAVREAFPGAAIVRPSVVFGPEDQFVNRFAGMIATLPVVPILGGDAKFQPVYVDDVARAIVACLAEPTAHAGATYELGGPEIISMRELNHRIAREAGQDPAFIDVPDSVGGAIASLTGWLPGAPITRDQWIMLQTDNVVANGAKTLADLGIEPTPMSAVLTRWMDRYRPHGRFSRKTRST